MQLDDLYTRYSSLISILQAGTSWSKVIIHADRIMIMFKKHPHLLKFPVWKVRMVSSQTMIL
jgi:hypothetical protein